MKTPDQRIRPGAWLGFSAVVLAIVIAGYYFRNNQPPTAAVVSEVVDEVVIGGEGTISAVPESVSVTVDFELDANAPVQIRNTNEFRVAGR